MAVQNLKAGDKVVFAKDKASLSPGKRAKEVSPARKGDEYNYIVEKYWTVKQVRADGSVVLVTRRGKEHSVSLDDPRLRRANLWERLTLSSRFPKLEPPAT